MRLSKAVSRQIQAEFRAWGRESIDLMAPSGMRASMAIVTPMVIGFVVAATGSF